jgi:hypothetical protein
MYKVCEMYKINNINNFKKNVECIKFVTKFIHFTFYTIHFLY